MVLNLIVVVIIFHYFELYKLYYKQRHPHCGFPQGRFHILFFLQAFNDDGMKMAHDHHFSTMPSLSSVQLQLTSSSTRSDEEEGVQTFPGDTDTASWNTVPFSLCEIPTLDTLKQNLKTHLFQQ